MEIKEDSYIPQFPLHSKEQSAYGVSAGGWYCNETIRDMNRRRKSSRGIPECLTLVTRADPRLESKDGIFICCSAVFPQPRPVSSKSAVQYLWNE